MSRGVLDASALLAFLNAEPGGDAVVVAMREGVVMSAINFAEVVTKLAEDGVTAVAIHQALGLLPLTIIDFDTNLAYQTGLLRPATKRAGLSLGDRACLVLAQHLGLSAMTTDRAWQPLQTALGVTVQVIR